MTYFEALFVVFTCLGDRTLFGYPVRAIPAAARPAAATVGLCEVRPESERWASRADAVRRVRALGPDAAPRLRACRGFKCYDLRVEWRPILFVGGNQP